MSTRNASNVAVLAWYGVPPTMPGRPAPLLHMVAPSSSPVPIAFQPAPTIGHLFVVEHDAVLLSMLCDYLEKQGWFVSSMGSAGELDARIDRVRPDVVVIGSGLPQGDALKACRRLRAGDDKLPIILLTEGASTSECAHGLQAGADECIARPVPVRVLAARARALMLRRSEATASAAPAPHLTRCHIGQFVFVPQTRSLHGDGCVRALNDIEFKVMLELVRHAGEPVTRERMLQAAGAHRPEVRLRSVDTAVMRLRRLLEPDPAEPRYLQTVRGRGYVFVPPAAGTFSVNVPP